MVPTITQKRKSFREFLFAKLKAAMGQGKIPVAEMKMAGC